MAFILGSARELGWSVWDRSIRSTVDVQRFLAMALRQLHAQVYSAIFVTNAAGALILSRAAAPVEWLTLGLAQAVFGLFAILGVVIVDATARRVDWALPATWLWLGIFAALFVTGLAMTWQAYAQRRTAALGARGSVNGVIPRRNSCHPGHDRDEHGFSRTKALDSGGRLLFGGSCW